MICLRVLSLAMLAVMGLDYVQAQTRWNIPVEFNYMHGSILNINIRLQNVPPVANYYFLRYITENCDANIRTEKHNQQRGPQCYETGKKGPIPKDGIIHITQKLNRESITLYIEILNSTSNNICSTKIIMAGVRDVHADKVASPFRACLNNYRSPCEIIVDFKDTCNDTINCTITQSRGLLACESSFVELPDDTEHQWYQSYNDGQRSSIGTIPKLKGIKTKFVMRYHQFDLNTYIHSKMSSTHWKTDLKLGIFKIPLSRIGYKKYDVKSKISYSESKKVHFTCSNNAHTQVGWIDPTGYKITTYNGTSYSWTFEKHHNNSIWCCIHYITSINGSETTVERTVEDITVLIYEEPRTVIQDDGKANTSLKGNKSQDEEGLRTLATGSSTERPAETPQDQHSIEPFYTTKYFIGIASVAGIIILISLIYVVFKKWYGKSSDPEQTLQLETYASTNAVLYAELDLRRGDAPPPPSTYDPIYAKIIGVLWPQNQNDKK